MLESIASSRASTQLFVFRRCLAQASAACLHGRCVLCVSVLYQALLHREIGARTPDSLSQSSAQGPREIGARMPDSLSQSITQGPRGATCKPRRPRWWFWAPGDALSGLRQLKALVYDDVETDGGARIFWALPYVLDAIPSAKVKPSVWLVRGGAPPNLPRFVAENGLLHRDFRPSRLSVRRGKRGHHAHRMQWLDQDYACGTLYLINLMLHWARCLKLPSSDAARRALREFLVKTCNCITPSEARELGCPGAGFDARVALGLTPAQAAVEHVISICSVASNDRATTAQLQALADIAAKIDMLILEGRSGDARHTAPEGSCLRGVTGRRRRIDQDVRAQAENDATCGKGISLMSIATIKGNFSKRTAIRQQHVRTLCYIAATARVFAGENQFSMCLDETTIGDEPTMGLCVYSTKHKLGAWLLPQAWRCQRQTG